MAGGKEGCERGARETLSGFGCAATHESQEGRIGSLVQELYPVTKGVYRFEGKESLHLGAPLACFRLLALAFYR